MAGGGGEGDQMFIFCHLSPSQGLSEPAATGHAPAIEEEDLFGKLYCRLVTIPSGILRVNRMVMRLPAVIWYFELRLYVDSGVFELDVRFGLQPDMVF